MKKKALLVTRVSGFVPQFETDAVHLRQSELMQKDTRYAGGLY